MMDNELLEYSLGEGVRAFSTMRNAELPFPVVTGHQVHGYCVAKIDRPGIGRDELQGYDAFVTNVPGCAIGARSADCVPLLMYDPVHRAVAAVHSGWKGTVQKISHRVLTMMNREYGTLPINLHVVIGPSICKEHFQVGNEVIQFFKEACFPIEQLWTWDGVRDESSMAGGHHIDLAAANKWLLTEAGVLEDNIHLSGICSYEDDRFFSARKEGFECGRTINVIQLL